MTVWLERSESRFLDLINISVEGLIKASLNGKNPNKYELFSSGSHTRLLNNINPIILDNIINNFTTISGGRYIRELAYVLLALDFAIDEHAIKISKVEFNTFEDIKNISLIQFIQSNRSTYLPTDYAFKFSKLSFASKKWRKAFSEKVLEYGYFCRWLDVITILQEFSLKYRKDDKIKLACLKNLIGPLDSRVSGSGPDFIQTTFKSWAFLLDLIDIKTNGKLDSYTLSTKLNYLRKHTGYITDGNDAYAILKNIKKAHIIIKQKPSNKIRVMGFMRLVNLEVWRRDFNWAISSALRRMRIMFILNKLEGTLKINELIYDNKIKAIMKYFNLKSSKEIILEDLLFLESEGMILETTSKNRYNSFTSYLLEIMIKKYGDTIFLDLEKIESKNIFYEKFKNINFEIDTNKLKIESLRRFDTKIFERYTPKGKLIEWIKTN